MLNVALSLGSGGLKGIAHIGVLRAIKEAEIQPVLYTGASVGAIVAGAAASGISIRDMRASAHQWTKEELFKVDLCGLLRRRRSAPSLYQSRPLRRLCRELFQEASFLQLSSELVVSCVDIETGEPVWWGQPGLQDVPVAEAIYASCAMPGLLEPGRVGGRLCVDGGVLDPLGLRAAASLADIIIAVDLDGDDVPRRSRMTTAAAPTLWYRAQTIAAHEARRDYLERWMGPPLLLVRPPLEEVHPLQGGDPDALIRIGYESARAALLHWDACVAATGGVFPNGDPLRATR